MRRLVDGIKNGQSVVEKSRELEDKSIQMTYCGDLLRQTKRAFEEARREIYQIVNYIPTSS